MLPKRKREAATSTTAPDVSQQLLNLQQQMEMLAMKFDELPNKITTQMDVKFEAQKDLIEELKKLIIEPKEASFIKLFPVKEKKFTLRHTFENVRNIAEGAYRISEIQDFFGEDWMIYMKRRNGFMTFSLYCLKNGNGQDWSIATENTYRMLMPHGEDITSVANAVYGNTPERVNSWGIPKFLEWNQVLSAAVDGGITLEIEVIITKMTGGAQPKSKSFDESQREFADVVLTVEGEDFYVIKKFLASRSSYFNGMFFSKYVEAEADQIYLPGVDAKDFRNFLQVVYGDGEIEDSNVKNTLCLANMFMSSYVMNVCEKFLLMKSKMTLEKKFELSKKYQLSELADRCIAGMTMDQVEDALKSEGVNQAIAGETPKF